MAYNHISNLETLIPEIPADTIVSRSIYKDENANVTLFGFAAGQELTEHTSSRAAMLTFLSGEAKLTLGEDEQVASAGTWVYMPPHLPHSIHALEQTVMLLTLV